MFPLRGGFLLCANCGHPMTGSSPRGRSGGLYPQYHCTKESCKKRITGISPSVSIDKAHEDFRDLLRSLKPLNDGVARLFKEIVIKAWNSQFENAINSSIKLNERIKALENFEFQINKKFIEGKINEKDSDLQKKANDKELNTLRRELEEIDGYKNGYKKIIDNAMTFITDPELFWNQAETPVKKLVQQFIAPNGLPYRNGKGFGTIRDIESYLLIQKIPANNAEIPCLVVATRIELVTSGL